MQEHSRILTGSSRAVVRMQSLCAIRFANLPRAPIQLSRGLTHQTHNSSKPVSVGDYFAVSSSKMPFSLCRRHPDSHTQRLNKTVRAVRRALSVRRGKGVRVMDSMLDRRSSESLHSPPPNVANMTGDSRAQVDTTPWLDTRDSAQWKLATDQLRDLSVLSHFSADS